MSDTINRREAVLTLAAAGIVALASSEQCFALQFNKDVSKDEAKKMGVAIRSNRDGENGIKVWIEFEPKGELKKFTQVIVAIGPSGKRMVFAPLMTSHPTPESVSAHFSTDAANVPASVLTIVVQDAERTRIGYQFKVQDFLEIEKTR